MSCQMVITYYIDQKLKKERSDQPHQNLLKMFHGFSQVKQTYRAQVI